MDDTVSLDKWTPKAIIPCVPKSEWRQKQIGGNYNQQPGLDELGKIKRYLEKNYPDHQIMDAFGLNAETLNAIKKDCYAPIDGIKFDNLSKIQREFAKIEAKLTRIFNALSFLGDNLWAPKDTVKRMLFKTLVSGKAPDEPEEPPKKKVVKPKKKPVKKAVKKEAKKLPLK